MLTSLLFTNLLPVAFKEWVHIAIGSIQKKKSNKYKDKREIDGQDDLISILVADESNSLSYLCLDVSRGLNLMSIGWNESMKFLFL